MNVRSITERDNTLCLIRSKIGQNGFGFQIEVMSHTADRMTTPTTKMSDGIHRGKKVYKIKTLMNLMKEDAVVRDENVQRPPVRNHPGSADCLFDSLANNIPIGELTAFVDGVIPPNNLAELTGTPFLNAFRPTKKNPLRITDGGHRSDWLWAIYKGDANYNGFKFAQLEKELPEIWDTICGASVVIDIAFHISGTVPIPYINSVFQRLQLSAPASSGELLKATDDVRLKEIVDKSMRDMEPYRKVPTDRGLGRTIMTALARGSYNPHKMSTKHDDMLNSDPLTDEEAVTARRMTQAYLDIYGVIDDRLKEDIARCTQDFESSVEIEKQAAGHVKTASKPNKEDAKRRKDEATTKKKEAKKAVDDADKSLKKFNGVTLDLALDGPMMYGLCSDPTNAPNYIKKWFLAALGSGKTWGKIEMVQEVVKAPKNSPARSYDIKRWRNSWSAVLKFNNALPAANTSDTESVDIDIAVE